MNTPFLIGVFFALTTTVMMMCSAQQYVQGKQLESLYFLFFFHIPFIGFSLDEIIIENSYLPPSDYIELTFTPGNKKACLSLSYWSTLTSCGGCSSQIIITSLDHSQLIFIYV